MRNKDYRWYVYKLVDPRTKEPFYIGKGTKNRVHEHEKEALKGVCSKKTSKIKEIWDVNLKVEHEFFAYFKDEKFAYHIESELIKSTPNLTNWALVSRGDAYAKPFTASDAYDALLKYMGEFAYWYKTTKGGKRKIICESSGGHPVRLKLYKIGFEGLYNRCFPDFLKRMQSAPDVESQLANELRHYGVQYGC